MSVPSYDVVIAVQRVQPLPDALQAISRLSPKEKPNRVILAVGSQPSEQRNQGVSICRSPLVYFLDDDSAPIEGTPNQLAAHFEEGRTAAAGGPNLPPPDATPFEMTISAVLASWLGSFSVRYRYASLGSVKEASEKELILCNLMVRRQTFLQQGGFRSDLYPNEENEFLNRLRHHGHSLMYDPQAAVYRPRRPNLSAFLWQCFRYGRGRSQQMRVYPCLTDLIHLVPAFFDLYLLTIAIICAIPAGSLGMIGSLTHSFWGFIPLALFAVLALFTGFSTVSWHRRWADLLWVPFLIFMRHTFYGIGMLVGFFTPPHQPVQTSISLYEAIPTSKGWKLKKC
jgi:cellulose synthase/poly-beta-1,6-N-acetylglucosamine synthase-like glycosyltransferase